MKKLALISAMVLLGIGSWYLFIQKGEFRVNLTAHTLPGDVIQVIKFWNTSLDAGEIVRVDSLTGLLQKVKIENRSYTFYWKFKPVSDTTTAIQIVVSEPGKSLLNKLLVPFGEPQIEKDAAKLGRAFYKVMKEHLEITSVRLVGQSTFPGAFCICTTLEKAQTAKAIGMMQDYNYLVSVIANNGLRASGRPMIRVKDWKHVTGRLSYDFCFPIEQSENLPLARAIFYQQIPQYAALKAIYNGNYITSDRAWYYLYAQALKKGVKVFAPPIEVFHNNPNMGLDEIKWKAEVYLPIIAEE